MDPTLMTESSRNFQENFIFIYPWKNKCGNLQVFLDHCIRRLNCTLNDSAIKIQSLMELDYKQAWPNTIHNGGKLRIFTLKNIYFMRHLLIGKISPAYDLLPINYRWRQAGSFTPHPKIVISFRSTGAHLVLCLPEWFLPWCIVCAIMYTKLVSLCVPFFANNFV